MMKLPQKDTEQQSSLPTRDNLDYPSAYYDDDDDDDEQENSKEWTVRHEISAS